MERLAIVLLVCGLLIFGCAAPSGNTQNNPNGAAVPASGGVSTPGPGAANGSQAQPAGGNASGSASGAGSGASDLIGKTYEELLGLGIPLQCDITTTSEGQTTKSRIYMQDKESMRSETEVSQAGSTCKKMVTIMKSDIAYIGCMDGEIFPSYGAAANPFAGCKWMEVKTNQSTTSVTASIGAEAPDYSSVPPSQINCAPWVVDASKFVVDGKSCDMQEIMKNYGVPGR